MCDLLLDYGAKVNWRNVRGAVLFVFVVCCVRNLIDVLLFVAWPCELLFCCVYSLNFSAVVVIWL